MEAVLEAPAPAPSRACNSEGPSAVSAGKRPAATVVAAAAAAVVVAARVERRRGRRVHRPSRQYLRAHVCPFDPQGHHPHAAAGRTYAVAPEERVVVAAAAAAAAAAEERVVVAAAAAAAAAAEAEALEAVLGALAQSAAAVLHQTSDSDSVKSVDGDYAEDVDDDDVQRMGQRVREYVRAYAAGATGANVDSRRAVFKSHRGVAWEATVFVPPSPMARGTERGSIL